MMFYLTRIAFAISLCSSLAHSAPTAALDAPSLLANGQEAQKLNAVFQSLKESDACTSKSAPFEDHFNP